MNATSVDMGFTRCLLRSLPALGLAALISACAGSPRGALLPFAQRAALRQTAATPGQIVVAGRKVPAGRNDYFRLSLGPQHRQLSRSQIAGGALSVAVHGKLAYIGGLNAIEIRDIGHGKAARILDDAGASTAYTVDAIAVAPDGTVYAGTNNFSSDGCPGPLSPCGAVIAAYSPSSSQNPNTKFGWKTLGHISSMASDASGRLYASWVDFSNVNHVSQILRGKPIDYPTNTAKDALAPAIAALPDGTLLIARSTHSGRTGSVEVYSTQQKRVLRRFGVVSEQATLAVSADGTEVFEADKGNGGAIREYAYPAGTLTAKFDKFSAVYGIAAAP